MQPYDNPVFANRAIPVGSCPSAMLVETTSAMLADFLILCGHGVKDTRSLAVIKRFVNSGQPGKVQNLDRTR